MNGAVTSSERASAINKLQRFLLSMIGDASDSVTRATDLAKKFEQHVYSTTHTRDEYFHLILLRMQQLQQQRKKAEPNRTSSGTAPSATANGSMEGGGMTMAVEQSEADKLIVQQKISKMAAILPALERLLSHPQAYTIDQSLLLRCSSLRTVVKKQLALLPQQIYIMNLTSATNIIDQLQHFTNQVKGLLVGDEEKALIQAPKSQTVRSGAPLAGGKDTSRFVKTKNALLSEDERSIVRWLRSQKDSSFKELSPKIVESYQFDDQVVARSDRLIKQEIEVLRKKYGGMMSIIYEIHTWGTAFRITYSTQECLGLRLFSRVYPSVGETESFQLIALSSGASEDVVRKVVSEGEWKLFSPITITTIVNLFLHSLRSGASLVP